MAGMVQVELTAACNPERESRCPVKSAGSKGLTGHSGSVLKLELDPLLVLLLGY